MPRGRIIRVLSLKRGNLIYAYRFQDKVLEDYTNTEHSIKIAGTNFSLFDFTGSRWTHALSRACKSGKMERSTFQRLYLYPIKKDHR